MFDGNYWGHRHSMPKMSLNLLVLFGTIAPQQIFLWTMGA